MIVSLNYLNTLLDLSKVKVEDIEKALTSLGLEVDEVKSTAIDGLVVGYVKDKQPHPKSTKLSICTVDIGTKDETIVCGAKNVDKGQTVCVATVGTQMSPDFTIGIRSVVGVESRGMICSMSEVGHPEFQDYDGIYNFEKAHKPGTTDPLSLLGVKPDTIIEIGLTPNRSDCNSIYQIAKELSAFFNKKLRIELDEKLKEKEAKTKVKINSKLVNLYTIANFDVEVSESSDEVKTLLATYGINSINNIVDATNAAMLITGNPLHAFDADKISDTLEITDEFTGKFIGVDDKEYEVKKGDITILSNGEVACLAGVMGSKKHGVDENTKRIALEAANFDHVAIRKTSKRLDSYTNSATRFIKLISVNSTVTSHNKFCEIMDLNKGMKLVKGKFAEAKNIDLGIDKLNSYLGYEIDVTKVVDQLKIVGVDLKVTKEKIVAKVDPIRIDISIDVDIIEEIVRFLGIDNIKPLPPVQTSTISNYETNEQKNLEILKSKLYGMNFNEVRTYSLNNTKNTAIFRGTEGDIKLANPLSEEREVMRTTLIYSLLEAAEYNFNRANGDVSIFESSKIYTKKSVTQNIAGLVSGNVYQNVIGDNTPWSYGLLKSVLSNIIDVSLGRKIELKENKIEGFHPSISATICIDGKEIGVIGKLHPSIIDEYKISDVYAFEIFDLDIKDEFNYEIISSTNEVEKDITINFDKKVDASEIIKHAFENEFVNHAFIKDVFEGEQIGENKKAVTLTVLLSKKDKTFNAEELEKVIMDIIKVMNEKLEGNHEWLN